NVITGSIIGGPDRITVRAENRGTRSGRLLASEIVEGPVDSLPALASRLALQLSILTLDASTRTIIAETQPAAVAATLQGIVTLCAAEWAQGEERQWIEGARRFETALDIDSTFAIAANLLGNAGFYFPEKRFTYDFGAARDLAWRFRERLPAADRLRLELRREGEIRFVAVAIDRYRDAIARFPNAVWLREGLENELFYRGEYAGVEGWAEELLPTMRAMAELDDLEGGVSCSEVWVLARLQDVPEERWADYAHCPEMSDPLQRATWRRDAAELRRLRAEGARNVGGPLGHRYFDVQWGFDITDWEPSLDVERDAARTFNDQLVWAHERFAYDRITGRPEAAARFADSVAALMSAVDYANLQTSLTPWYFLAKAMEAAAFEPGPALYLSALEDRMYSFPDTAVYDPHGGWNSTFNRLCPNQLARVAQGDTSRTVESIATLLAWKEGDTGRGLRFCTEMIVAMFERVRLGDRYAISPAPELARLDSIFSLGPKGDANHLTGPLVLARLYWERADTTNAWKWVRRRQINRRVTYNMAPWLRSDGRISVA
ncbi:MAG: hypothetical protein ACC682_17605, partial [Gemmatimonadota bacterium]